MSKKKEKVFLLSLLILFVFLSASLRLCGENFSYLAHHVN
jgi:hypothetical protein